MAGKGSVGASTQIEKVKYGNNKKRDMTENEKAVLSKKLNVLAHMSIDENTIFLFFRGLRDSILLIDKHIIIQSYSYKYSDDILLVVKQANKLDELRRAICNKQRVIDELQGYCIALQNNIKRLQELVKTGQTELEITQLDYKSKHQIDLKDRQEKLEERRITAIKDRANDRKNDEYNKLLDLLRANNVLESKIGLTGNIGKDISIMRKMENKIHETSESMALDKKNWEKNRALMDLVWNKLYYLTLDKDDLSCSELDEIYLFTDIPYEYMEYTHKMYKIMQLCLDDTHYVADAIVTKGNVVHYIHALSTLDKVIEAKIRKLYTFASINQSIGSCTPYSIKDLYRMIESRLNLSHGEIIAISGHNPYSRHEKLAADYLRLLESNSRLPKLAFPFESIPDIALTNIAYILYKCKVDNKFTISTEGFKGNRSARKVREPQDLSRNNLTQYKKTEEQKRADREENETNKRIAEIKEYISIFTVLFGDSDYTENGIDRLIEKYGEIEGRLLHKVMYLIDKPTIHLYLSRYSWEEDERTRVIKRAHDINNIYETLKMVEKLDEDTEISEIELKKLLAKNHGHIDTQLIIDLFHKKGKNEIKRDIEYCMTNAKLFKYIDIMRNSGGIKAVNALEKVRREMDKDSNVSNGVFIDDEVRIRKSIETYMSKRSRCGDPEELIEIDKQIHLFRGQLESLLESRNKKSKEDIEIMENKAIEICSRLKLDYSRPKTKADTKWESNKDIINKLPSLQLVRLNLLASYTDATYDEAMIVAHADKAYTKLVS